MAAPAIPMGEVGHEVVCSYFVGNAAHAHLCLYVNIQSWPPQIRPHPSFHA